MLTVLRGLSGKIIHVPDMLWVGDGIVTAHFDRNISPVRLVVSSSETLSSPTYSASVGSSGGFARMTIPTLDAGDYYFAVETGGSAPRVAQGQFRVVGNSFMFATAGDNINTHQEFTTPDLIRAQLDPDFFVHLGDIHYADPNADDDNLILRNWRTVFKIPSMRRMLANLVTFFIWDDHDYGENNSDETDAAGPASRRFFRNMVPVTPASATATDPVHYTLDRGRCRFIFTDGRSARKPITDVDDASKTMLGATQKAWFKDLIENSDGMFIIWVGANEWDRNDTAGDGWRYFQTEQTELADHIKTHAPGRVLYLGADCHRLRYDVTHSDYSTTSGSGIRVINAAPLWQGSHQVETDSDIGPYYGDAGYKMMQFATVAVDDQGGSTIDVIVNGYQGTGPFTTGALTGSENFSQVFTTSFEVTLGA